MYLLRSNQCEITFLVTLLFVSAAVRLPGLFNRAIWSGEAITLLEIAGHAVPSWPKEPAPTHTVKKKFIGAPTLSKIAADLRQTDVHPPVYYWGLSLWRYWLGFSLETARAFSLICSIGTILALYLLLRAGKIEYPLIPTMVYAMSTGAVHFGHEARAYALASLLVMLSALFAYRACEVAPQNKSRAAGYSITMAICCGAAFSTNYLAVFPVCVILSWALVCLWPGSRSVAIVSLLVAVSVASIGFSTLLTQLGTRPHQYVGFVGIVAETKAILRMNLNVIWLQGFMSKGLTWGVYGGLIVLIGATLAQILQHWQAINRKLWVLLLGLACVPSIGLVLLDLQLNKHLHEPRYLMLAGPALAVMVAYGITRVISSGQRLGVLLVVILLGFQMAVINWGIETGPRGLDGSRMRSLASTIKTSSSPSHIVVIDATRSGRGDPGTVIYELDPHAMFVVLTRDSDLTELLPNIQNYDDVWIVFSMERATLKIENNLLSRLQESGRYSELFRNQSAIHLRKVTTR